MNKDRKSLIKKLLNDSLTEEESNEVLHSPNVEKRMRSQWDQKQRVKEGDGNVRKRIWNEIQLGTTPERAHRRVSFYKWIAVASCLLLLVGTGVSFYWVQHREQSHIYVVSSGIRSIESVVLPDGTRVQLGSNSRLTYPEHFTTGTREVELTGQAFFNVTTDKKPFTVHAGQVSVTALGTAFEVFNYANENKLETILREGKVRVELRRDAQRAAKEIILAPNEMAVFDKQLQTFTMEEVNAKKYSAWSEQGILSFENERLYMIISRLEPWYGRKIKCPAEVARDYRFTFKVRDESLERILFMMRNSSPIQYKEVDGEYELYVDK